MLTEGFDKNCDNMLLVFCELDKRELFIIQEKAKEFGITTLLKYFEDEENP